MFAYKQEDVEEKLVAQLLTRLLPGRWDIRCDVVALGPLSGLVLASDIPCLWPRTLLRILIYVKGRLVGRSAPVLFCRNEKNKQ